MSPVATVSTPRCSARSRRRPMRRVSPRSYGRWSSTRKRLRPNACASCAAPFGSRRPSPRRAHPERQTSPCGQLRDGLERHRGRQRLAVLASRSPRSRVSRGQQPAQVPVALPRFDQQRDVRAAVERELRARDGTHAERLRRMRELERAVDAVVVGEGKRLVPELGGAGCELLRLRRSVEEAERGMTVELDIAAHD